MTAAFSVAVAACANNPSGGSAPAPASQAVGVMGPSGNTGITIAGSNSSHVQTLPYSVDLVWRALPAAFDSIGVPVAQVDAGTKTIGNPGYSVRRRLKSTPLSRFIDCGTSPMGPSADDYDVRLTVLAEVHPAPDGGGAAVTTTVTAAARPANYAQDYSACSSRGTLETRLIDALKGRLGK